MTSCDPLRVALLGPGSSIHLQRWAHALVAHGHSVCVVSQHRCDRELLPAAAQVIWLPWRGSLGYFTHRLRVWRELRKWRPDVLNIHYASGYGTMAAFTGSWPTVLSVWGSDVYEFPYQSAIQGWLLRGNLRRATLIASTSEVMARQVRQLISPQHEVEITPFGVDLGLFAPCPENVRPTDTVTVGIVKSLAPKYGVDLLLHAFSELLADEEVQAKAVACRLLIVGDGPQREELAALAQRLGIANRTELLGRVPHADVSRCLSRLDIFVAPSRFESESFGVAVIEASACAVPVVVSDVGGLPEVVRHGETGLVVPGDDVQALKEAIKRLVLDASLRGDLGRRGRMWVERQYAWDACVAQMERCYRRALAIANSE